MNLAKRSYLPELLDQDVIPFADIRQNLEELNFINRWLGGHGITVEGFKRLAGNRREISVCEIGCGGGDNLLAISRWCKTKNINLQTTGIDIKSECINFARSRSEFSDTCNWIISDYKEVSFDVKPDIIFSSLFCHHFNEEGLVAQFKWMKENSKVGFFINDLQRNVIAYYSIKLLTRLLSKSYLVKHDAPLSVARGFHRRELIKLLNSAATPAASIEWKWAFRYLILHSNNNGI